MNNRYVFVKSVVSLATTEEGVYALYDRDELIYYGKSEEGELGIRGRLLRHIGGDEGGCTQGATHWAYEACDDPAQREVDLLAAFQVQHERLPRCNDVQPSV